MKEVEEIYDNIAETYVKASASSAYNAYYERPAMLELLGDDLGGKNILDVGSASGFYIDYFLRKGATVSGVDLSSEMVSRIKDRIGEKAVVLQADVSRELPFPTTPQFDLISASLMMHYIEDWVSVFQKFKQWLLPGGRFVFSTHHPIDDFDASPTGIYSKTELIRERWKSMGIDMVNFRRPLATMFKEIREGGFEIVDVREPLPVPELKEIDLPAYEKLSKIPPFILFDCVQK